MPLTIKRGFATQQGQLQLAWSEAARQASLAARRGKGGGGGSGSIGKSKFKAGKAGVGGRRGGYSRRRLSDSVQAKVAARLEAKTLLTKSSSAQQTGMPQKKKRVAVQEAKFAARQEEKQHQNSLRFVDPTGGGGKWRAGDISGRPGAPPRLGPKKGRGMGNAERKRDLAEAEGVLDRIEKTPAGKKIKLQRVRTERLKKQSSLAHQKLREAKDAGYPINEFGARLPNPDKPFKGRKGYSKKAKKRGFAAKLKAYRPD